MYTFGPLCFPYDEVEDRQNENTCLGFSLKCGTIKQVSMYFCLTSVN